MKEEKLQSGNEQRAATLRVSPSQGQESEMSHSEPKVFVRPNSESLGPESQEGNALLDGQIPAGPVTVI